MKTEKKPKQRQNKSTKPDFKHAKRRKNFVKKSKVLYKRKFNTPLTKRKKQKNIYDAIEEARYENGTRKYMKCLLVLTFWFAG